MEYSGINHNSSVGRHQGADIKNEGHVIPPLDSDIGGIIICQPI